METLTLAGSDGQAVTAISLVYSIYVSQQDRIFANISPKLKELVSSDSRFTSVPGHVGFPDSFKDTTHVMGGLQLSFSRDGYRADIDTDIYNIAVRGSASERATGRRGHILEVLRNKVTGRKTDPYRIWQILRDRGLLSVPHYDVP